MGRGAMMEYPGGPWRVTDNFDIWDIASGKSRPDIIQSKNDDDPNSIIGGGKLNLTAGAILYRDNNPALTVFAYGKTPPRPGHPEYPSECKVMTQQFLEMMGQEQPVRVKIFDPNNNVSGSGTFQELKNILVLASEMEADKIIIVSVLTHMGRIAGMLANHLLDPTFRSLRTRIYPEVSEFVIMRAMPTMHEEAWEIFGSKSMYRNLLRDAKGLEALFSGITQSINIHIDE